MFGPLAANGLGVLVPGVPNSDPALDEGPLVAPEPVPKEKPVAVLPLVFVLALPKRPLLAVLLKVPLAGAPEVGGLDMVGGQGKQFETKRCIAIAQRLSQLGAGYGRGNKTANTQQVGASGK